MATTFVIVPAWSDQAGQCRIVSVEHHDTYSDGRPMHLGLQDYRRNPDRWREAGLMDSRGKLVCLDASAEIQADIRSHEPLMAGLAFTYPKED